MKAPEHLTRAELGIRARDALLWMSTTTVVWQGVSWVLTLLTARILLPADYGLAAILESLFPYLVMAARLDLTNFISQRHKLDRSDESALMSLSLLMNCVVAVVGFIGAPTVGVFYGEQGIVLPLQLLSLTFIIRGFGIVPDAMLRRELCFKPVATMNLIVGVARGFLQLLLASLGFGFWSLLWGIIFRDVALAIACCFYRPPPCRLRWDTSLTREVLSYGLAATAASLCWVFSSTVDYIIVGKLLGVEFLGYYSMAYYLADLPLAKVNTVLRTVTIPLYGRLRDTPSDLQTSFLNATRAYALLVFPTLVGIALVAPRAVPLLLGSRWEALVVPLQVMCCAALIRAVSDNVSPLLLGVGQARRNLIQNFAYAVIMPLSFLILGRSFGVHGIYAAWLVVYPLVSGVSLVLMSQTSGVGFRRYFANLLLPIGAVAAMGVVVSGVEVVFSEALSSAFLLILEIALGGGVYTSFVRLFGFDSARTAFQLIAFRRSGGVKEVAAS